MALLSTYLAQFLEKCLIRLRPYKHQHSVRLLHDICTVSPHERVSWPFLEEEVRTSLGFILGGFDVCGIERRRDPGCFWILGDAEVHRTRYIGVMESGGVLFAGGF